MKRNVKKKGKKQWTKKERVVKKHTKKGKRIKESKNVEWKERWMVK